jgi:hypothetical protein
MITHTSLGPLFLPYTCNHNKPLLSILTSSLYSNIRTSTKPGSLLPKLLSFLISISRRSFGRYSSLADSGHGVSSLYKRNCPSLTNTIRVRDIRHTNPSRREQYVYYRILIPYSYGYSLKKTQLHNVHAGAEV